MRPAVPQDQALIDSLFCQDRARQLAATGLAEAQISALVQMQARGRAMTYTAQFPAAKDWILLDENRQAVGRLLLNREPDRWRIVDIAVLADRQGRGLGTTVLKECQRQAEAVGATLELRVEQGNPARRLYARLGFQVSRQDSIAVEMVWDQTAKGAVR